MIKDYIRDPFYYETDQMNIINHTHFIKWMEESRIDYLRQIGAPLEELEAQGIVSPVLEVNCQYKNMVRFGDRLKIKIKTTAYNGVKLFLSYSIENERTGVTHAECKSSHCFLDKKNNIISLKKMKPDIHNKFMEQIQ